MNNEFPKVQRVAYYLRERAPDIVGFCGVLVFCLFAGWVVAMWWGGA